MNPPTSLCHSGAGNSPCDTVQPHRSSFYSNGGTMNIATLPSVSTARLPQTYEAARAALAECQNIDECQDWADKAAALASYAKQAEDETLMKMAARIKARATRRAGELLMQIQPAKTGPKPELGMGDHTQFGRSDAARDAGMSKHQQVQATRVAAIPEDDFERQVESLKPPTLSQLAQQGMKPRPLIDHKGRDPREFNRALHFVGSFENYARDLERESIESAISILTDKERLALRGFINRIDAIHDRIMTRI